MDESIRIDPNKPVIGGTWGTWNIIYSVGSKAIAMGGGLQISYHASLLPPFWIDGDWTPLQCDNPTGPGYVTARTTGNSRAVVSILRQSELPDHIKVPPRSVRVEIADGHLYAGDELIVTFGDTSRGSPGICAQHISQSRMEFSVLMDYSGKHHWELLPNPPYLEILGSVATSLRAYAPSIVQTGVIFPISIRLLDSSGYPATGVSSSIEITSDNLTPAKSQTNQLEVNNLHFESSGIQRFVVNSTDLKAGSNPILVEPKEPVWKIYWGDIHGHSDLSDGLRTPDDYYRYARDVSRLDFTALTDHEPNLRPRMPGLKNDLLSVDEVWDISRRKTVEYHKPGSFITFSGYEWTSGQYGHKCVYYLTDDQPIFPVWDPKSDTPAKLYSVLQGKPALIISHHPAGGPAPANLSSIDPSREPIVEIYSCHGCSETPEAGRPIWRKTEKGGFYVRDAINQGFHFGIIAGSDTHTSDPGNPLVRHPLFPHPYRVGIMAVYAKELTRQALWEALWARRVYATTGERILLDFKINSQVMGSDLTLSTPPLIQVLVAGTAPLAQIELIHNGLVVNSWTTPGLNLEMEWQEEHVNPGYYYLRVVQEDGEMAWSSPIWVHAE